MRQIVQLLLILILSISAGAVCPEADLSGNCRVDAEDLIIFAEQWLDSVGCGGHPDDCADFVGNDGVSLNDLAFLTAQWGVEEAFPIVINEIHFNPDLPYELVEFVELYNAGDEAVDLSGWYFSKGISYAFDANTEIPAGGYIVVTEDASLRMVSPLTSVAAKYGTDSNRIFGPFTGSLSNEGETIELRTSNGVKVDQVDYQLGFPWPTVGDGVPETSLGSGHSIQLVNAAFDNDLGGNWRSAYPTPGAANAAIYSNNLPPLIRQVAHTPQSPATADTVTVTAKVTDSDGVGSVALLYQIVMPGSYIALQDAAYNNWTSVAMHDNGLNGDRFAGDSIYCVQLPAITRVHRYLIRYRIRAEDTTGHSVTVPYADDPQPNFAYFVYNGVPPWTGADQPGVTPEETYDSTVMNGLPVYHLLSKKTDVENATWYSKYTGSDYLWGGTMVYDGQVYDHIRYRARGGVWRYAMGKNMWKFDFNRGHFFQARDDYGQKYKEKWDKLNFSACIQQGDFGHRGEQGMFEAAGFRMFNMMGVEAPHTNWLQFRIIDQADENGATQYNGDLWGLYLAIEQMDGRFLTEHERADGNLYKIEGYNGTLNNQGPTQPVNGSDYTAFKNNWYNATPKPAESWWRQNVELNRYYSYRCIVEGIHHGDIAYGKNYFFYNDPQANIWTMYPWDLDLTWANNMYGDGSEPFINSSHGAIFSTNPQLRIEYNNRLREFHDLFYNTEQLYSLLDELGSIIDRPDGGLSIVDVDRAMWDYNPLMVDSSIVNLSKAGQGRFYQVAGTKDFPGMIGLMKNYITGSRSFDTYTEDPLAPATPQISCLGDPNYPENDLRFQTSAFSDPQGSETFAAVKWRLAEVEPYAAPPAVAVRVIDQESDWRYFKGTSEPSDPMNAYRLAGFDDSSWLSGQGPIGYGESMVNTTLGDMRGNYTTIYLRKTFFVSNPEDFGTLTVGVLCDDGYNLWINGNLIASNNVAGSELPYGEIAVNAIEPGDYELTTVNAACLVAGTNVIAIQALNASKDNSSDCVIDALLEADSGSSSNGSGSYPLVRSGKPGKYEIEPVWESAELTPFVSDIRIPTDGVKPGHTYRVRCRMKDDTGRWSHWSDPIQFVAGQAKDADILHYLRITELMYNNGDAEFIELKNTSSTAALDLSSVSITNGVQFSFAGSDLTSLAPGAFVLVVKDLAAFHARYGTGLDSRIAGVFIDSSLSNSGETIKVEDFWNGTIIEFEYHDARGWPLAADGAGHSLVPLSLAIEDQPLGTLDFGGNWRQSAYIGGSPGTDDPSPLTGVVINEIMAHTDFNDPVNYPGYDSNDWIELYNAGDSEVNLNSDWYLSDDSDNLKKWMLPSSTLSSGGWVSFDEITGFHSSITSGFGLDKAGEQVYLSYLPGTGTDRVVDCVRFKGQENGISLSRYPDGNIYWFHTPTTIDTANSNPVKHVVISEIMYHPTEETANEEYIELYNPTGSSVNLWTVTGPWALDGGVDYEFPASITLTNGGRIIIVGFDPAVETVRLDAFETAYGTGNLTPGVDIFGPWSGDLSNNGERISLERPQDSDDPLNPAAISWVIVDECIYNDYWPWPTGADGTGLALKRLSSDPTASGNNAANWIADISSAGL